MLSVKIKDTFLTESYVLSDKIKLPFDQISRQLIRHFSSLFATSVDSDATGQPLIIYFAFVKYLRKNGNTMKQCVSSL